MDVFVDATGKEIFRITDKGELLFNEKRLEEIATEKKEKEKEEDKDNE